MMNLEAGGVEPPSEKPCSQKPTCLSHSGAFFRRATSCEAPGGERASPRSAKSGPDTLAASPVVLAAVARAERQQPARCATPHLGPTGQARGDGLLID